MRKIPIVRIREDFEKRFEQPGYSADEISNATTHFGRRVSKERIRSYAGKEGLRTDLQKAGIDLTGTKTRYLIPNSSLGTLMKGTEIGGTVEELVEELERSRDVAASDPNRRNRASRKYR